MKKKYFFLVITLIIINSFIQVSCTKAPSYSTGTTTPPPVNTGVTISMFNMQFLPDSKTVANGTVITWKNGDNYPHTVTSNDGFSFNSGSINGLGQFIYTATRAGTFKYHCTIHGMAMSGTLIVNP